MGASNALVGILNAIAYSTYFLMPIGKRIVRRKPIVWTFGWAWVGRYTALVPILFAPLLAARGHSGAALGLLVAGAAGFAVFRGIALIGNNPVVGFLASGGGEKPRSDRGQYMVTNSLINSVASMISGLLLALFLGEQANPWSYALGIGFGIAVGVCWMHPPPSHSGTQQLFARERKLALQDNKGSSQGRAFSPFHHYFHGSVLRFGHGAFFPSCVREGSIRPG